MLTFVVNSTTKTNLKANKKERQMKNHNIRYTITKKVKLLQNFT